MNTLKHFRLSKGLTQEAMSREIDVTLAGYSQIERGVRPAGRQFISKLKKAFPEIDVNEMFFSEEGA